MSNDDISARYVMDTRKRLIHDFRRERPECGLARIKPQHRRTLFTKEQVVFEVNSIGFNGCPHCMPELDYRSNKRNRF